MLLVHDVRPTTQDIDGWIVPENHIERHIRAVGVTLGDEHWLNEQALMYFPDQHPGKGDFTPFHDYGHLSVQVADERTMFAMKANVLRNPQDRRYFQYLAEILNIRTVEDALIVIGRYYRELTPGKSPPLRECWMRSIRAIADIAQQDATLAGAYQWAIGQFLDDFRSAAPAQRSELIAEAPAVTDGRLAALPAGIVDALCDETGTKRPEWLSRIGVRSPRPFFVMRPEGDCTVDFAFTQMLYSPPWFFSRDVFVPGNYLVRA